MVLPVVHTRWTLAELPAQRGTEPWPDGWLKVPEWVQVSPMLSEYAILIWRVGPKFVQLMKRRPVSGSISMNSLSAAAPGIVAMVFSRGPLQVTPPSVDTCTHR